MAIQQFKALYDVRGPRQSLVTETSFLTLPPEATTSLSQPVSYDEVRSAIFAMGPFKSPGPDGFQAIFYQSNWQVISLSVLEFVKNVMERGNSVELVNETLLVLIPKVERPESIQQFRPISLCNVSYKIITKLIAMRLQGYMSGIISPNQSSFVPGRHIQDNIVLAQELVHTMDRMKRSKKFMLIKVDLEKAYDRLSWDFLEETLNLAGIPSTLTQVIMNCVSSASMQVLWNGEVTETFKMRRGIRQGCPLSPYLFVLCIERLSHVIADSVQAGRWRPIRIGTRGPPISHLMFADDLLLFAEASVDQIREIRAVLQSFCNASGQSVSTVKSVIYFSKNVPPEARSHIASIGGFVETLDLGKYLGIPIVHGRVRAKTFQGVVNRVRSRLSSWAAASLSLAGRTTLVQSVLQALPTYSMHIFRFPGYVCNEIDILCRKFLWGHTEARRKIHLVNWATITKPKSMGGLGLYRLKEFNTAILGKIVWGLINRPNELWARVLLCKYSHRWADMWELKSKKGDSWLWKAIVGSWNDIRHLMGWGIGDGNRARFWADRWIYGCEPLESTALLSIPIIARNQPVRDFITNSGTWNWDLFSDSVSHSMLLRIASSKPPSLESSIVDFPLWFGSKNGEYSISSTYAALIMDRTSGPPSSIWRLIWNWEGPHRIRFFLWLVSHDRLLTNEERFRRHLASTFACPHCPDLAESIVHVLRDCYRAREVWISLIPSELTNRFFSYDLKEWLQMNLSRPSSTGWPLIFATTCWLLWFWRNKHIFQPNSGRPPDPALVVRRTAESFMRSWILSAPASTKPRRTWTFINWKKPLPSQWKLNTDGASRGNPGVASAGGLIRDSKGNWMIGFMQNLGHTSSVMAELWGVFSGLDLAWNSGYRNLVVETDSQVVRDIITHRANYPMMARSLVMGIQELISREWNVTISHTYREGNVCADWLARRASSQPLGFHVCQAIPDGLYPLLVEDSMGVPMPRFVVSD